MARYIDADKLIDKLEELQFNAPVMTPVMKIYNVVELVEDQPTADVVEVKHAKWVNGFCSNCKQLNPTSRLNEWTLEFEDTYLPDCPHCGAKMDGKDTNVPTK